MDGECVEGRQLHEKITATVTLLKWRGVSPNDRVLLTLPVCVDFYAIAIAVFAIGTYESCALMVRELASSPGSQFFFDRMTF